MCRVSLGTSEFGALSLRVTDAGKVKGSLAPIEYHLR